MLFVAKEAEASFCLIWKFPLKIGGPRTTYGCRGRFLGVKRPLLRFGGHSNPGSVDVEGTSSSLHFDAPP